MQSRRTRKHADPSLPLHLLRWLLFLLLKCSILYLSNGHPQHVFHIKTAVGVYISMHHVYNIKSIFDIDNNPYNKPYGGGFYSIHFDLFPSFKLFLLEKALCSQKKHTLFCFLYFCVNRTTLKCWLSTTFFIY